METHASGRNRYFFNILSFFAPMALRLPRWRVSSVLLHVVARDL